MSDFTKYICLLVIIPSPSSNFWGWLLAVSYLHFARIIFMTSTLIIPCWLIEIWDVCFLDFCLPELKMTHLFIKSNSKLILKRRISRPSLANIKAVIYNKPIFYSLYIHIIIVFCYSYYFVGCDKHIIWYIYYL